MSIIIIGTLPTLLFNANPKRTKLKIQMQAQSVDANNTGRVHLGYGFQAVATVGHASQGDILIQTAAIEEPAGGGTIDTKYKRSVWATASAANQSLIIEEEVEEL